VEVVGWLWLATGCPPSCSTTHWTGQGTKVLQKVTWVEIKTGRSLTAMGKTDSAFGN